MTKIVTVQLEGAAPYSQSKHHTTPKLNKELAVDYEARTWYERCHVNEDGFIVIPAMAFKNCLSEIAQFLGIQIPGKGKSTYTKHFTSGILVQESPLILYDGKPVSKDDLINWNQDTEDKKKPVVYGDWCFVPSDGVRGSGKRVDRCYPVFSKGWTTTVDFLVLDDMITEPVFVQHLKQAGQLIGIGRFRVRNNGTYGRFIVKSVQWRSLEEIAA